MSAVRCIYRYVEEAGWVRPQDNPARRLPTPSRRSSHRYAIPSGQVAEICQVAATSGDDPELDFLILRFHLETACRRGGALALRPQDLDRDQCLVFLREKGGSDRWKPVSPTQMRHLNDWGRISESLPWVATQCVTAHWLRHTTLTWVERTFSYAVARAFAGHRGNSSGTPDTYVKSHLHEVAAALAVLTGEPHPLARGVGHTVATPTRDLRLTESTFRPRDSAEGGPIGCSTDRPRLHSLRCASTAWNPSALAGAVHAQ
ncbi:tyrosine-type recombinase/integrase [Nocardia sp. SC052]|uniref:tyrosine-type recombinase/integrase n=1 Tax=Nocardia sichangensis TaxID=3385975 RepID=UPI0039A117EF